MGIFVPSKEVMEIFARIGYPGKTIRNPVEQWPFEHPQSEELDTTLLGSMLMGTQEEDLSGKYEYNFVYKIHDGALVVTKQKFTYEEFSKFASEINIEEFEAVAFTGGVRG